MTFIFCRKRHLTLSHFFSTVRTTSVRIRFAIEEVLLVVRTGRYLRFSGNARSHRSTIRNPELSYARRTSMSFWI